MENWNYAPWHEYQLILIFFFHATNYEIELTELREYWKIKREKWGREKNGKNREIAFDLNINFSFIYVDSLTAHLQNSLIIP